MQLRTSNIIMIIKGNHKYGNVEPKEAIKKYMAETCGCDEADYTDGLLMRILSVVVQDYIATCDNPQRFMYDYFDALATYYNGDSIRAWISALQLSNIRHKNVLTGCYEYVNGFNEDNTKVISENTGELMFPEVTENY